MRRLFFLSDIRWCLACLQLLIIIFITTTSTVFAFIPRSQGVEDPYGLVWLEANEANIERLKRNFNLVENICRCLKCNDAGSPMLGRVSSNGSKLFSLFKHFLLSSSGPLQRPLQRPAVHQRGPAADSQPLSGAGQSEGPSSSVAPRDGQRLDVVAAKGARQWDDGRAAGGDLRRKAAQPQAGR